MRCANVPSEATRGGSGADFLDTEQDMGRLTTHVLDTASGKPAAGLLVELVCVAEDGERIQIVETTTNSDGRTDKPLLDVDQFKTGTYELSFHVAPYFKSYLQDSEEPPFLDVVNIRFTIAHEDQHYHVPLLTSPWS